MREIWKALSANRAGVKAELRRAGDGDGLARDGVVKAQGDGTELMPGKPERAGGRGGFGRGVARVAQQRMADVRHVHAQLMRATGERVKLSGVSRAMGASISLCGGSGTPNTQAWYVFWNAPVCICC